MHACSHPLTQYLTQYLSRPLQHSHRLLQLPSKSNIEYSSASSYSQPVVDLANAWQAMTEQGLPMPHDATYTAGQQWQA